MLRKLSRLNGSEGLFSDHFINGTQKLNVFLFVLFTLFLCLSFSPDSIILGTVIPNHKRVLFSLSNYGAIELSSILSKILDRIILI